MRVSERVSDFLDESRETCRTFDIPHSQSFVNLERCAAEGKEREMKEDDIIEMSQSGGYEGGRQEEEKKDREVESNDEYDDADEEELLESLAT